MMPVGPLLWLMIVLHTKKGGCDELPAKPYEPQSRQATRHKWRKAEIKTKTKMKAKMKAKKMILCQFTVSKRTLSILICRLRMDQRLQNSTLLHDSASDRQGGP